MAYGGPFHIALALGGGGARCLAHLGVLRVLEREAVPVNMLVGKSVGAILAALYALIPRADQVCARVEAYLGSEEFRRSRIMRPGRREGAGRLSGWLTRMRRGLVITRLLRKPAVFDREVLARAIGDLVPDRTFEETLIPLGVGATDLVSGEEVLLSEGKVRPAVVASCALPGFFPPVREDGRLLGDVGLAGGVPVDVARALGAHVVIAVDVSAPLTPIQGVHRGIEALLQAQTIAERRAIGSQIAKAHAVVRPDIAGSGWLDFSRLPALIRAGEAACEAALPAIRSAIEVRRREEGLGPSPSAHGELVGP